MQDALTVNWKQFRKEVSFRWNRLKSEDVERINGRRENLVSLLETEYGFARVRAEKEVDSFVTEFDDRLRRAALIP